MQNKPHFDVLLLWSQHQHELRRWLQSRELVGADVEDILQDVLLKCLRQGSAMMVLEHPRAWLFEVLRNTWTDRLRRSRPTSSLPDTIDELPAMVVETDAVDELAQSCLPRVLGELDAQDREIIELCDLQGITQLEYARLKNLSLSAVKSRIQRARRRMRQHMLEACQVALDDKGRVVDFVARLSPEPSTIRGKTKINETKF